MIIIEKYLEQSIGYQHFLVSFPANTSRKEVNEQVVDKLWNMGYFGGHIVSIITRGERDFYKVAAYKD